jgi:hypothetical protein
VTVSASETGVGGCVKPYTAKNIMEITSATNFGAYAAATAAAFIVAGRID